jgi:serine protease Do
MKTGVFGALVLSAMLALPATALAKGPESVAALAAQLSPAVVNIGTTFMVDGSGAIPPGAAGAGAPPVGTAELK